MKAIFRVGFLILAGTLGAGAPAVAAAPASALEGEWRVEQANSTGSAAEQGTLTFTGQSGALTGALRVGAEQLPVFDVKETGTGVSFTVVIPGMPYITVHYLGARTGDEIRLVSPDEGHGVFTLTASRAGAPAPQASPPVAAVPPPSQVQTASLQAPPSPPPNPSAPARPATSAGQLQGSWTAQQQSPGSAAPIEASLVFTGNRGTMHVGSDDWALFDVKEGAGTASFTLVIPGAPYVAVHYSGTISGNELNLASIDPDQAAFRLTARRAGTGAAPPPATRPAAAPPAVALLNPPPPAPQPQPPRVAPAPRVEAQPAPSPPVAGEGPPPPKVALPALRDLPPNNLAKTPLMGWASRQKLGATIEDDIIRQAAEGLDELGLRAAGYTYVEVDEGWQGTRDANGTLRGNAKFPDMKALVDYVHSKRLKFGLQASAAPKSCGGFEGSYGHEAEDAKTFAAWGIDYLVYDWCGADSIYTTQAEQQAAYQKMAEALRGSGRDIVFGVSQNGAFDVAQWAGKAGANIWRTGRDLEDNWQSVTLAGFGQNGKEAFAGPGRWNDPGLLQVGNGTITADEARTQLNLWALMAAPLMLGNDVRIMTRETLGLLTNGEVIAIDQDPLGRQAKRVAQNGSAEVWARPLADGSMAVAFFNRGEQSAPVAVSWQQLGLDGPRRVRDLWWHQDIGTANLRYVVFLTPHTSLLLKMSR